MRIVFAFLFGAVLLLGCGAENVQQTGDTGGAATPASTAAPLPTTAAAGLPGATETTALSTPEVALVYYWPRSLPEGFVVDAARSQLDEQGFFFRTNNINGREVRIVGGTAIDQQVTSNPAAATTQTISIRGQAATLVEYADGSGPDILWQEGAIRYAVLGTGIPRDELIAVAEGLESLDRATWQQQLAAATVPTETPAAMLAYLWPNELPTGWVIRADRSTADPTAFALELSDPANPQGVIIIRGGSGSPTASGPPHAEGTQPVTIRGQEGVVFSTGGGAAYYWREDGQPYSIEGFISPQEVPAWVNALEPLDLSTWQARLAAVAGN